jgi:uncharacterized delta-60 repeat protein
MKTLAFRHVLFLSVSLLAMPAEAADIPGGIEPGYVVSLGVDKQLNRLAVYPGMRLLIQGNFEAINGMAKSRFARLMPDGSIDGTFDTTAIYHYTPTAVIPGGKIFIGASRMGVATRSSFMGLLNPDGLEDKSSVADTRLSSPANCAAVQPDGKIVMVGRFIVADGIPQVNVARMNADGTVDPGFAANTNNEVHAVAVQPDGKILIAGQFTMVNGQERNRIARLNADGSLEDLATFNAGKGADGWVHAVAVQPDGRILLGGHFHNVNGALRMHLARLNANGTLEAAGAFNAGAFTKSETRGGPQYDAAAVDGILLQADGRILVNGTFDHVKGMQRPHLARLMPDGTPETKATFDPRYVAETRKGAGVRPSIMEMVESRLVLQADGRMILGARVINGPRFTTGENHLLRMGNYPATEALLTPNATTVQWARGGSAPEVSFVNFEVSTDNGMTWKALGPGVRIRGGWQCAGLNLPASGLLRASGSVPSGCKQTWPGVVEKTAPFVLGAAPRKP